MGVDGKLEGHPLRESLGADGGSKIGSYNSRSYGEVYSKFEGSYMGESLVAESVTGGDYDGSSYGKVVGRKKLGICRVV